MKEQEKIFEGIEWCINKFKPLGDDKRKSVYREGGVIRVEQDQNGIPVELLLKISGRDDFLSMPMFMGLCPTYTVVKGVHVIVAIVGNNPCELHKIILRFGRKKDGRLWFKFEVIPLYVDCVCDEEEDDEEIHTTVLFMSGHGVGGGTGGKPVN